MYISDQVQILTCFSWYSSTTARSPGHAWSPGTCCSHWWMCPASGACLHWSDLDRWASQSGELGMNCEEQWLVQLHLSSRVDSLEKQLLYKIQNHMKLEGRFPKHFSWQFRRPSFAMGIPWFYQSWIYSDLEF